MLATVRSGASFACTMRFSVSKVGCENSGREGKTSLRACSETPLYPLGPPCQKLQ